MSYDVQVGDADFNYTYTLAKFNYTYNLAKFFIDFNVHPTAELHGLTGEQAADAIDRALRRIVRTPLPELVKYNPDNGWGGWLTATAWLMEIRDAGRKYPYEKVTVS